MDKFAAPAAFVSLLTLLARHAHAPVGDGLRILLARRVGIAAPLGLRGRAIDCRFRLPRYPDARAGRRAAPLRLLGGPCARPPLSFARSAGVLVFVFRQTLDERLRLR